MSASDPKQSLADLKFLRSASYKTAVSFGHERHGVLARPLADAIGRNHLGFGIERHKCPLIAKPPNCAGNGDQLSWSIKKVIDIVAVILYYFLGSNKQHEQGGHL